MSESKWRKTDKDVILEHCPGHERIGLYYYRIYTPGAGYEYSQTNRLIFNIKKPVVRPAAEIHWKEEAIQKMALEIIGSFENRSPNAKKLLLVPTPGSKTRSHPEYDSRLQRVVEIVCSRYSKAINFPVLRRIIDSEPQHISGQRDQDKLYAELEIDENMAEKYDESGAIVLVDDVVSSGCTFTACRMRLLERFPEAIVKGLFWARSESRIERPSSLLTEIGSDDVE